MTVRFLRHVALEVPAIDIDRATRFYTDFGLQCRAREDLVSFRCASRRYDAIHLVPGSPRKRIHHVSMGTDAAGLESVRASVRASGLTLQDAPRAFAQDGIWFRDAQGLLFHVVDCPADEPVATEPEFRVNGPGHCNRINAGALPPRSRIADPEPRKLGHVLLFTPDVDESIAFLVDVLGMRLSDRADDIVAFLHCRGGSDHHVIALAKSGGIGFHHASFLVGTPDEVGLGGCRMIEKGHERGWGFGRHAIGSNFFHYVRDPWGSYVEYYSDIDYIGDSDSWVATNWPMEDSLHTWGPNPPADMVHNYELD